MNTVLGLLNQHHLYDLPTPVEIHLSADVISYAEGPGICFFLLMSSSTNLSFFALASLKERDTNLASLL